MVQCPEGGKVNVLVGGQVAQEYQVEEKTEGNIRTYTCFIEAIEGREFEVVVDGTFTRAGEIIRFSLEVDRCCADRLVWCSQRQPKKSVFSAYHTKGEATSQTRKVFTFGKMQTTNESWAKPASVNQMEACAITLKITPQVRIGEEDHEGIYTPTVDPPSALVVHEDSKAALFGLSAVPGRDIPVEEMHSCRCHRQTDNDALTTIVIFKYLPRRWLIAKGIIEEGRELDGDDEVQIDTWRTERVASRRRAREEREGSLRSVRVKREVKREMSVKTEATVNGEEAESRMIEVVDLTVDGEYVPPSRKIGETIVLDEDSDGELL